MNTPANIAPVSLADIAALLDAKVDSAFLRQNEAAAKRDAALREEMAKRDAALRDEFAKRDAALHDELAKRDAALAALRGDIGGLREDIKERDAESAKRETRLMKWFANVVSAAAGLLALVIVAVSVGFGVWLGLRDQPTVAPITVNIPPAIQTPAAPVKTAE